MPRLTGKWEVNDNKLSRQFVFDDFKEALDFVSEVGRLAEEQNHHPDIHVTGYRNVVVEMTSHDAGDKVTAKDHVLAGSIDKL